MSLERITELASDLETSRRAWAILHESAQRDAQRFQKRITELVEKVNSYVVESARQGERIAELEDALSQTSRLAVADVDASRAVLMLDIAAQYILDHCPDGEIFYDETECDGSCVADDCEIAAQALCREAESREGK